MSSLMEGNWNAPSPAVGCELTTGSSAEQYVRGGGLRIKHLYYLDMNSTTYVHVDEEQIKQALEETDATIEDIWNN